MRPARPAHSGRGRGRGRVGRRAAWVAPSLLRRVVCHQRDSERESRKRAGACSVAGSSGSASFCPFHALAFRSPIRPAQANLNLRVLMCLALKTRPALACVRCPAGFGAPSRCGGVLFRRRHNLLLLAFDYRLCHHQVALAGCYGLFPIGRTRTNPMQSQQLHAIDRHAHASLSVWL